jgi:DoxX-like family
MTIPIIAQVAVDVVSAIFVLAGLINLSGSTHLRAIYRLWHYPHNFYRVVGSAQMMAALFLIVPETRIWGIAASGIITFIATVTLLHHRQYLQSVPVMLLLVSLVPASLAHS